MGIPAVFCPWSGSGRALRSVSTYEEEISEGLIGHWKDIIAAA